MSVSQFSWSQLGPFASSGSILAYDGHVGVSQSVVPYHWPRSTDLVPEAIDVRDIGLEWFTGRLGNSFSVHAPKSIQTVRPAPCGRRVPCQETLSPNFKPAADALGAGLRSPSRIGHNLHAIPCCSGVQVGGAEKKKSWTVGSRYVSCMWSPPPAPPPIWIPIP